MRTTILLLGLSLASFGCDSGGDGDTDSGTGTGSSSTSSTGPSTTAPGTTGSDTQGSATSTSSTGDPSGSESTGGSSSSGSGSSSSGSSGTGGSGDTTTGGASGGVYGPCPGDMACEDGLECQQVGGGQNAGVNWCTQACDVDMQDCPEAPEGDAEAFCRGMGGGGASGQCLLACTPDTTCPTGMECVQLGGNSSVCAFPADF